MRSIDDGDVKRGRGLGLEVRSLALILAPLYRMIQTPNAWKLRSKVFRNYEPEYPALRSFLPYASPGTIVDVGANFGQSCATLRRLYPRARIEAFEPNQELAESLAERYVGNDQVNIHAIGLGSQSTNKILYTPVYRGVPFYGLSSEDQDSADRWFNPKTTRWFDGRHLKVNRFEVPIRRLDDFIETAVLVKIDVEGAEVGVLEGATTLLEVARPILLVETVETLQLVRDFLAPFGYVNMELVDKQWVWSKGVRRNQLFIRKANTWLQAP